MPNATHIHFASHGIFEVKNPLKSGLVLGNQDRLTIQELQQLHSVANARLIVLSACQTSITEFHRLPNEAISIPSAFLAMGISAIVGSLWSVDDKSTSLLIREFYSNYMDRKKSVAAALRDAQVWLRDITRAEIGEIFKRQALQGDVDAAIAYSEFMLGGDPSEKPYAHPYFWAAFSSSGI